MILRRLRCRLQSFVQVVYSSSSANASVVVADSLGLSFFSDAVVVVVNSLRPLTHRFLRCHRSSIGRVVYSASSANAYIIDIVSLVSSSSSNASVVVANSSGMSLRRRSLCRCPQILAASVVVSNSSYASFIPRPPPMPPSSSSILRAS